MLFLLGMYFVTASWHVMQRPAHDTEKYVYDLLRQKRRAICSTLLDALKELARLDSRHVPIHPWPNRAAGRFRWLVTPWYFRVSLPLYLVARLGGDTDAASDGSQLGFMLQVPTKCSRLMTALCLSTGLRTLCDDAASSPSWVGLAPNGWKSGWLP